MPVWTIKGKLLSIILVIVGIVAITVSVVLTLLEAWSPTHSAVSPENDSLSIRLALLAGLGWLLLGLGIGSRFAGWARSPWVFAAGALGMIMGFLAWFVIHFMLTS